MRRRGGKSNRDNLRQDTLANSGPQGCFHDEVHLYTQRCAQVFLKLYELEKARGAMELHQNIEIASLLMSTMHIGAEETQRFDPVLLTQFRYKAVQSFENSIRWNPGVLLCSSFHRQTLPCM